MKSISADSQTCRSYPECGCHSRCWDGTFEKSVRSTSSVHAVQGDERIRTAVCAPGADAAYERILSRLADQIAAAERLADRATGEGFTYEMGRVHAFTFAREIVTQERRDA